MSAAVQIFLQTQRLFLFPSGHKKGGDTKTLAKNILHCKPANLEAVQFAPLKYLEIILLKIQFSLDSTL